MLDSNMDSSAADDSFADPELDESSSAEEDYSFERWQREKGYKSPDELGKAYGNANKHIQKIETENKKFRDYIQTSIPWVRYAEQKYKEEQELKSNPNAAKTDAQPGAKPPVTPGNGQEAQPDLREMVKQVTMEILGPQINGLKADLTNMSVNQILKNMREDKKTFPYMSKEVENEMNEVLTVTNKSFPVTEKGIRELYNAAVGRSITKILGEHKNQVTEEISENQRDRDAGFMESDRVGEAGNVKSVHKDIVDSIINAPYGKSQI